MGDTPYHFILQTTTQHCLASLTIIMAGSKKNKIRKILSPLHPSSPGLPDDSVVNDSELMDELMAQLDSKDQTVQIESATVINDMQLQKAPDTLGPRSPSVVSSDSRQSSRSRHQARQVR